MERQTMKLHMYRLSVALTAALALFCVAPAPARAMSVECNTVNNNNFNHYDGAYRLWTADDVLCDYPRGDPRPSGDGQERKPGFVFVKGAAGRGDRAAVGNGVLRMEHPEGCVGTDDSSGCGILYSVRLPEPLEYATLSYKFKFDSDYHWTRGGKLPGMCDHDCPTGCQANSWDGGWSSRVMWRDEGKLVSYMYLPPQSPNGTDESNCGEDYPWDLTGTQAPAISDMWHSVKIYVGRNSFVNGDAQSDGVQKVWLDGELVFHKTDWIYDWTGEHLIDELKYQNFHGGSSVEKFAPNKLQYVWVDDVAIQEGECPPDKPPTFQDRTICDHPPGAPAAPDPNPTSPSDSPSSPSPDTTGDETNGGVDGASTDTAGNNSFGDDTLPDPSPGKETIFEEHVCVSEWGVCARNGKVGACCNSPCVRKNEYYAQCRPMPVPDTWTGEIVQFP